jgi:hypothetical protein
VVSTVVPSKEAEITFLANPPMLCNIHRSNPEQTLISVGQSNLNHRYFNNANIDHYKIHTIYIGLLSLGLKTKLAFPYIGKGQRLFSFPAIRFK